MRTVPKAGICSSLGSGVMACPLSGNMAFFYGGPIITIFSLLFMGDGDNLSTDFFWKKGVCKIKLSFIDNL